jgi:hypothetical protein
MRRKIAQLPLALVFALVAGSSLAVPAVFAASPGACNMLNFSPQGAAGMDGSGLGPGQGEGLSNMIDLVVASLGAGCTP